MRGEPQGILAALGICLLLLLGCSLLCLAAALDEAETWSEGNTSGWSAHDLVNEVDVDALDAEDDCLRLTFNAQQIRFPPEDYLVKADDGASAGRFTGNYITNGIKGLSFLLRCDFQTDIKVAFYGRESGRLWRYQVPGITSGCWQTVNVPLDLDYLANINGGEGLDAFAEDLADIAWVGVIVRRNDSMSAQTYRIDDFVLVKAGAGYAQWIAQFAESTDGSGTKQPGDDLDGDGLDNYSEWVAGTSADDPDKRFRIEFAVRTSEGTKIEWESVEGRTYEVWRSSDLVTGFEMIASGLTATPPLNTFEDTTATGDGPFYYRLQVELSEE